jgi:hypothetical protein
MDKVPKPSGSEFEPFVWNIFNFCLDYEIEENTCVGKTKNEYKVFGKKTERYLNTLIYLKSHLYLFQITLSNIRQHYFYRFLCWMALVALLFQLQLLKRIDCNLLGLMSCTLIMTYQTAVDHNKKIQCQVKTSNLLLINVVSAKALGQESIVQCTHFSIHLYGVMLN